VDEGMRRWGEEEMEGAGWKNNRGWPKKRCGVIAKA